MLVCDARQVTRAIERRMNMEYFFSRNFGSVVLRCSGRKELESIKAAGIRANSGVSVTEESSMVLQDSCCCCSSLDVCCSFDNHERHKPRLLLC